MAEKKKTLEDHLKEKIAETGYPLEIEISNLLDKKYSVYNTFYYYDLETKGGRSIDMFALPRSNTSEKFTEIFPSTSLAIECKKSSTHAWIFFSRPNNSSKDSMYAEISGQCKSSIPNILFPQSPNDYWIIFALYPSLHYSSFDRISTAYVEIKKQENNGARAS